AVTGRLGETIEKVNVSILSDQNLANVDGTIANLKDVTGEWKKASAELQPGLAEAREAIRTIQRAADGADKTIADLKPAFKDVPKAVNSISSAADEAKVAIRKVSQGNGLLGTLASDKNVSSD